MLRTGFLLLALATMALAQDQNQPPTPPPTTTTTANTAAPNQPGVPESPRYASFAQASYDDVYCGGFLAPSIADSAYVLGGWNTPDATRFSTNDFVYLHGTYQEGSDYTVLRRVKDPNKYEGFAGQNRALGEAGGMYQEMGRIHIKSVRPKITIAHIDFTCDAIVPGDIVVPFKAKEIPVAHGPIIYDEFAVPNGKLTGRIIGARDFDYLVGTIHKVYLDVGADKGVKVGDYFRVTRTYQATKDDPVDSLSFKATVAEDTQYKMPKVKNADVSDYPRRTLGELQITDVEAKSSTGMIAYALEPMFAGDRVELDELPPAIPTETAANPPVIRCTASPVSVRIGDQSQITCDANSPDDHPLSITFKSSAGQLTQAGNNAVLSTAGVQPGPIEVLGTATDDRNLSSSSQVSVNVEGAPTAPAPSMINSLAFKPNSGYVDNRAKAMLDDVALRMQNTPDATVALLGSQMENEPKNLAAKRALNAKAYLTSKGIDPKRIDTRVASTPGQKVDIWMIPAGAQMPPEVSSATQVSEMPAPAPKHKTTKKK